MPSTTVIIPSHNMRSFVGAAIESVLAQTHRPIEVLVIDDSTDDSASVVAPFEASAAGRAAGVKLLRAPACTNSRARNLGLEQARGDLVAFLDADDVWLPTKLERQAALLAEEPEAVGCFTRLFTFRQELDDLGRPGWDRIADDPTLLDIMHKQTVLSSAVMLRRAALARGTPAIRFDERTNHAEDTIFAADLRLLGRWRLVEEPLLARRVHPGSLTASPWHTLRNIETRIRWCRERWDQDRLEEAVADELERSLLANLVTFLEDRYWRRQVTDLAAMRDHVREHYPEQLRASFLWDRQIYPRWVYRLRDLVGNR